jgi:hypothetical protein
MTKLMKIIIPIDGIFDPLLDGMAVATSQRFENDSPEERLAFGRLQGTHSRFVFFSWYSIQ